MNAMIHPRRWLPGFLTFLLAAAVWQVVAALNPYVLPRLESVAGSLASDPGMYAINALITLQEVLIGFAGGVVVGVLLAVMMSESPLLERALMPLMTVVMVTPVVAIAPALVVAFGFGMAPKYIVTGIVVFFPVLVTTLTGLRSVDPRALDVLRTVHASRAEVFWHLRLPGSLPFVFAGLRTGLPLAVVGAAVAEFVAAGQQAGLGSLVNIAAAQANLPVTWASIFLLAVMGLALLGLLSLVRRPLLWWSQSERSALSPVRRKGRA